MPDPRLLLEEIAHARKSIGEPKAELEKKVYPFLSLLAKSMAELQGDAGQRIDLLEDAMSDFLNSQESMLLPELAQQLVALIALGLELCRKIAELGLCTDQEEAQKITLSLHGMVEAYTQGAGPMMLAIQDITIEQSDDDEGEEEKTNG